MEAPVYRRYAGRIFLSVFIVSAVVIILGFIGGIEISALYLIAPYVALGFILFFVQYVMKVIKFYLLCMEYGGGVLDFFDAFWIRVGSELFSLIGFSYLGDEAYRVYVLNRKYGVKLHRSGLIGYLEVLSEVVVSLCIVVFGIVLLLVEGITLYILVPIALSASVVSGINLLVVFKPHVVGNVVKSMLFRFRRLIGRERTESLIRSMDSFIDAFNEDLGSSLFSSSIFYKLLALTFVSTVFGGLSLWVISVGLGYEINIIYSIIILNFSVVLSTLPITISGSGIFELVILFLGGSLIGGLPWLLPIAYRVSSYYIPLVVTLVFFITGMGRYLVD